MSKIFSLDELSDKIVFLTVRFSRFGNFRKANVNVETDANQERFGSKKTLLKSKELKAIADRDLSIRKQVESLCLPYETGLLIAPIANYIPIKNILKNYAEIERPQLIDALKSVYLDEVENAKEELKGEFNPKHYPSVESIADEFTFHYQFASLSIPEVMKDEAQKTVNDAVTAIAEALTYSAKELVSRLADALQVGEDGKAKKLYDCHFEKLQEFLAGVDIRNVIDHKELKTETDKLKQLMVGVDPEKVRHNDTLRADLAAKMSEAAKAMTAMVQVKGRKFRNVE